MPNMANITVKNAANVDVVYSSVSPSAGDKVPAVWRANALSPIIGHRPAFRLVTRDNSKKNGRVIEGSISFPITAVINGQETIVARVPLQLSGTLPTNVGANLVQDAFVQFGNLLVSTLIRQSAEEGASPT